MKGGRRSSSEAQTRFPPAPVIGPGATTEAEPLCRAFPREPRRLRPVDAEYPLLQSYFTPAQSFLTALQPSYEVGGGLLEAALQLPGLLFSLRNGRTKYLIYVQGSRHGCLQA